MLGLGSVLWALWGEGIPPIRGIMLGLGSVLCALWEEAILGNLGMGKLLKAPNRQRPGPSGKREFLAFCGIMPGYRWGILPASSLS